MSGKTASVRRGWVACVLALACFVASTVRGEVVGGSSPAAGASHAWLSIPGEPSRLRGPRWLVLHAPPRQGSGEALGAGGGTLRAMMPALEQRPVVLAAWGNEVTVVLESEALFPRATRAVGSIRVEATGVGEYWATRPMGMLRPEASLASAGEIIAGVGTAAGAAVLIASWREAAGESRRGPSEVSLHVLWEGAWRRVVLPAGVSEGIGEGPAIDAGGGAWRRLVATERGLAVIACGAGRSHATRWWVDDLDAALREAESKERAAREKSAPRADESPEEAVGMWERRRRERAERAALEEEAAQASMLTVAWETRELALPAGVVDSPVPPEVLEVAGQRVAVYWARAGAGVLAVQRGEGWRELWRGEAPSSAAIVGLSDVGRVGFFWATGAPGTAGYGLRAREVSVFTGREEYIGAARAMSPVSATDLRLVAFALLGISVAILLFVLRSEAADKAIHLPEGTALAEGWRRGLAMMIDLGVALVIASRFLGTSVPEAFGAAGWLTGVALPVLGLGLGLAFVACTLLEWAFGRTLGKMIAGCEVVAVGKGIPAEVEIDGALARPTLWRSMLRNALKWGIPPIGVFMAIDADGRHPADVLARTAVVVRLEDEEIDES